MKRRIFIGVSPSALAILAFADAATAIPKASSSPSPTSSTSSTKTLKLTKDKVPVQVGKVLKLKGVVSQIVSEKSGTEIVYLKVGKKVEEITIDSQTKVKNAKGKIVSMDKLKKGEKVQV